MLPKRISKPKKRASRWRSQAHLSFVRSHACSVCGSMVNVQAAHVRNGSGAGMDQKPDDWRAVSLCGKKAEALGCHEVQHLKGERTFWSWRDVEALIEAFIKASPKRFEIEQVRKEREHGA
jgi:hypothetical protein